MEPPQTLGGLLRVTASAQCFQALFAHAAKKSSLLFITTAVKHQDHYGNASWIPSPNNQEMPAKFQFQKHFLGNGARTRMNTS